MLEVRPLGEVMGAEVLGVDPVRPLTAPEIVRIEQAFVDHLVLRFHGVVMNPVQLRDFGRQFGPLRAHVAKNYRDNDVPEVVIMTNQDAQGNFDPVGAGRGDGWHSDGTFEAIPPKATVLHALAVPTSGGNTRFANMYLAYETMPVALRSRIEPLNAMFRLRGRKYKTQGIVSADDFKKMTDVMHPVCRVHPVSGKKSIFVNPHHTLCIADMPDDESEALLAEIFAWCERDEFQWEQQWSVGDTIMWENRSAWHRPRPDYPFGQLRKFLRTTICERDSDVPAIGSASSASAADASSLAM